MGGEWGCEPLEALRAGPRGAEPLGSDIRALPRRGGRRSNREFRDPLGFHHFDPTGWGSPRQALPLPRPGAPARPPDRAGPALRAPPDRQIAGARAAGGLPPGLPGRLLAATPARAGGTRR